MYSSLPIRLGYFITVFVKGFSSARVVQIPDEYKSNNVIWPLQCVCTQAIHTYSRDHLSPYRQSKKTLRESVNAPNKNRETIFSDDSGQDFERKRMSVIADFVEPKFTSITNY